MNERRVIYYSDARHYHMYIYDPPIRLEEAYAPVDEAAGTSANTRTDSAESRYVNSRPSTSAPPSSARSMR